MKLETFQIRNCFGFIDSGEIDLSDPGNLVYFLGRNSSGKTSVLRAISYLEHGQVPSRDPRFENYERSEQISFLMGRFSVNSSSNHIFSVDTIVDEMIQQFGGTSLQVRRQDETFVASPSSAQSASPVVSLLNHVGKVYSDLVQRILDGGHASVAKLGDGSYQFFARDEGAEEFRSRRTSVIEQIRNVENALNRDGFPVPGVLDFDVIEGLLFKQFPEIFFFTEQFSLRDELPRSLDEKQLRASANRECDQM